MNCILRLTMFYQRQWSIFQRWALKLIQNLFQRGYILLLPTVILIIKFTLADVEAIPSPDTLLTANALATQDVIVSGTVVDTVT